MSFKLTAIRVACETILMSDCEILRDDTLDALRLNLVNGIGPRTQQILIEHFGSPANVFRAQGEQLRQIPGIGPKLANGILAARDSNVAEREVARCRERGIDILLHGIQRYPRMLAEICDAPKVLYVRGTIESRDELAVGIVGSRRCTIYGKQQAERLGGALARAGMTVVSGLARGIDAAAHRGALEAGGRTIAVLATGLEEIYPPEHVELAEAVVKQGALVTESPLDQVSKPGLFPQRNRIISGLSLGVIIVEASRQSGALHTARHAMEQGREVFAVPGRIDSLASEGCHDLIRDGVQLVRGIDDVLESLGPLLGPVQNREGEQVHAPRELTLNDQERQILNHVSIEPTHVDQILEVAEIDASRVLATLTVLEMKRMVRRLSGGYYIRSTS
jgi:DNA processing protein